MDINSHALLYASGSTRAPADLRIFLFNAMIIMTSEVANFQMEGSNAAKDAKMRGLYAVS